MKQYIGSGLLVAVAVGSLLVAGSPVSAATHTSATGATAEMVAPQVKPPKIKQVRYACHSEGAVVVLRLRNPNRVELSWQVRLFNADEQQAQAVTLAGKTAERVRFGGLPDGEFSIHVLDDLGETVVTAEVVVECLPAAD
jgi:hypothetical protein